MMIYASTACLYGVEPLSTRLERYQSVGLNAIELGAGVTVDGMNLKQGNFLIHNYFPPPPHPFVLNLASSNQTIQNQSIALASNALELTAQLGAAFYSVHAGFITDPVGFGSTSFIFPMPESPDEVQQALDRFIASIHILLEKAALLGIDLLIENNVCDESLKGKLLLQTPEEFVALFDHIQSPHLGVLMDTGHLNVSATTFGFDRQHFASVLQNHIRAIHLHDNDGLSDQHHPALCDSWAVDTLKQNRLTNRPIIVEAKFQNADLLKTYIDELYDCIKQQE